MLDEIELSIHPISPESVQHNTRIISNTRNITASLFGIVAGTLGLESYPGFAFYACGTLLVSSLVFLLRANGGDGANGANGANGSGGGSGGGAKRFFYSPGAELWAGDVVSGLMSFVLTWTLFYGLVGA